MTEPHYRDTEQWNNLVNAVEEMQAWQDQQDGRDTVVVDFVIVGFTMPKAEPQFESDEIAGYMHMATRPYPHTNRGLIDEAADYWAERETD